MQLADLIPRDSPICFPVFGLTLDPPASFTLFGREIYFYGVLIAAAFLAGMFTCTRNAEKIGAKADDVYDLLLWLMPVSILGARAYFVLFRLDYYLAHPAEIPAVWEGGLAIYGGVLAGIAVIWLFCRKRGIRPLAMLDLFATACILGQAIGRWGNFLNREAFGCETEIFCRMGLTDVTGSTIYVHPTFLYESLWCIAGFCLLRSLLKKRRFDGQCLFFYFVWYGTGRFFIEGLRTDSLYIPHSGIRVSQVLSALLALLGAVLLFRKGKHSHQAP